MADYSKIKHLKDLNNSMFNERMNRAYDYGYEAGLARGTECGYKRGYENGKKSEQTDEMSLSDAINWMKDYFRTTDMPMPQYEKAFEMAIKSMEYIDDHAL